MQHLVKTVFKSGSLYSKQNFHFLTTIGADSIKVKIAEKKTSALIREKNYATLSRQEFNFLQNRNFLMGQPLPHFVYFCSFGQQFYRKIIDSLQDLNSDRQNRRRARSPPVTS